MTEIVLKLMLLRYNMLSKERAAAISKCMHTGEDDEWAECVDEMTEIENELREYGCEFVRTSSKAAGETRYGVYKIVLTDDCGFVSNA